MFLISSIFMNIGLNMLINYNRFFLDKCKELNSPDLFIAINNADYTDSMQKYLSENDEIENYDIQDAIYLKNAQFTFGSTQYTTKILLQKSSAEKKQGKINYIEKSDVESENAIYLSLRFKNTGGYDLGDDFELSFLDQKLNFKVNGFYEDLFMGSVSPDYVTGFILSDNAYQQVISKCGSDDLYGKIIYIQQDSNDYEALYDDFIKQNKLSGNNDVTSISSELVELSCMVTPNLVVAIIIAFSLIIIAVGMVVTKFMITNFIDEEIQNLGSLKAMGYKSSEIILVISIPFILTAGISALIGSLISVFSIKKFAELIMADIWIKWNPGVDVIAILLSLLIIITFTALKSRKTLKRINNTTVIDALRLNSVSRSFKKNVFPLDRGALGVNIRLALKSMFQSLKQNIAIMIIVVLINFASCFGLFLYYNIGVDNTAFINTLINERYSGNIVLNPEKYDETIIDSINGDPSVKKALYYDTKTQLFANNKNISVYITDDFNELTNDNIYKGTNPSGSNEIAVNTMLAKVLDVSVGDTLKIELNDGSAEYKISGLFQSGTAVINLCKMTSSGFRELDSSYKPLNIIFYTDSDDNIGKVIDNAEKTFGDKLLVSSDYSEVLGDAIGTYVTMVSNLVKAIVFSTLVLVALVLALIIKTMIVKTKQDVGIKKALGYRSFDIRIQILLSIVPVIIIGALIGMILSILCSNLIVTVMFSAIGVVKVNFLNNIVMYAIMTVGFSMFAVLVSYLLTNSIKKISPYNLIKE